ncbi:MAG: hypothetical protein ACI4MO_05080 [Christensenellales bacterium]
MKKYKKLQKQVDASLSEMKDEQLLLSLKAQTSQSQRQAPKPKRNWTWAFASVVAVLLVCVVSLTVLLPMLNQDMGQDGGMGGDSGDNADYGSDIGYCEDFEKVVISSVEELNGALQKVRFSISLENSEVQRVYDDVSKDTLMFIFRYENLEAFDSIVMHVITNTNYVDRTYADKVFDKSCQYKDHLLEYKESVESVDGFYEYNIDGKLTINEAIIYFTYQNFALIEDSGMIETLDNIIQIYD